MISIPSTSDMDSTQQFQQLEYLYQSDDLTTARSIISFQKNVERKTVVNPTLQDINIIELKTLQTMFNGFKYMLRLNIRNFGKFSFDVI